MIALNPLAPIFLFNALFAISVSASWVNSNFTPSNLHNFWYCLTIAFLGLVKIFIKVCSSKLSRVVITGNLPTNSGIIPCFIRSSGKTFLKNSPSVPILSCFWTSAPKPITFLLVLAFIIFSSPSNAPPTMKRIFLVSISINSWLGCFLPPSGGTCDFVPSIILSKACCTPSPETSLVIETFSDFLAILSNSSI